MMAQWQAQAVVLLVMLVPPLALSAEKARDWQSGKVLDTERSQYFIGTVGSGSTTGTVQGNGTYQGQTNTSQTAIYRVYQTFAIEGDTQSTSHRSDCDGSGQSPLISP
jgi:hypothetical protein